MSKIVTMYNNKGGVSKTTTLFNLGVYISLRDKRVLFVDCDPQCNLTELFLSSSPDFDDPDCELPGTSIYQAIKPRFAGETAKIDPKGVNLVESVLYKNLFLFRGDLELSLAETPLSAAWNQAVTEEIHHKNTYVALYNLFHGIGALHNFDYILCDVGPSTGAITRTVFLLCDGFFIPLIPDRFCNQAVKLLGQVIHEWTKRHQTISATLLPYNIAAFPGNPILLGAIIQNYKIHAITKAKESYIKWQEKISNDIKTKFLGEYEVPYSESLNVDNPYVATIRDVGVLAPVSQMFGRAIFDIQQEHTKEASTTGQMYYGSVWQPWQDRMAEYKAEIKKLADVMP